MPLINLGLWDLLVGQRMAPIHLLLTVSSGIATLSEPFAGYQLVISQTHECTKEPRNMRYTAFSYVIHFVGVRRFGEPQP